jgi:hypothetical protein
MAQFMTEHVWPAEERDQRATTTPIMILGALLTVLDSMREIPRLAKRNVLPERGNAFPPP